MAKEQRLPLEAAHKAEKERLMHCRSLQERLILVKKLQPLATVSITEVALEEALTRVKKMMAHQVLLRPQHQKQQPWVTFGNRWYRLLSPMKQSSPKG